MSEWFIAANEIHRRYDDYGVIQVFDDGNKRYLSFGTADEQSCLLKHQPIQLQHEYSRAMLASLLLFAEPPQQISLLGLGGGLLTSAIHRLLPDAQINVVELRAAVLQVARQYFALPRNDHLNVNIADAGVWLAQAPANAVDWLLSDLFLADGLDQQQLQENFLDHCHQHLAPGGWLVLNLWREHRDQAIWLWKLKQRFPITRHATTKDGNWILWAQKPPLAASTIPAAKQAQAQAKRWSAELGFNVWRAGRPFFRDRSYNKERQCSHLLLGNLMSDKD
ncbi:spermidine synthase [Oceanobacter antarcticus]|jgi:spermidine synthase|uniref:Methyltransferase n=1 Tax=Oceanobacter antarcticus TaxID=3133425 RepID=A0ABW8NHP3_9GAMM